jgi:hypothetical protein
MSPTKAQLIERHEQLLKLDEVLTEHEKTEHFSMKTFATKTSCGTICCLAGHAARQPWFAERGFTLDPDGKIPVFDSFYGGDACDAFFGAGAYVEIFEYSLSGYWPEAMNRVRARLERIKAMP